MRDSVIFSIRGKDYTVKFPNVGEFYRIESMKQVLGKGFYNSLTQSPTVSSSYALDMIDIEATLSVLCPDFVKDLKVKNFADLGIADFKEIRDVYIATIVPFMDEVMSLLRSFDESK